MFDKREIDALSTALRKMAEGFADLPSVETKVDFAAMTAVLGDVAVRMQGNYPYHHPLYVGQMLKPPHPVARAAYALSMWINPNNHALDGGRASSAMEKEAVADLATMFGWSNALGHLCSGGTMANLEALWVASRRNPGKKVVAGRLAHYTHERISRVLGLEFESVPATETGVMDIEALNGLLKNGDVGTVVATVGTTGLGTVDPLPEIVALRDQFGFRLHIDAAYGGYFIIANELEASVRTVYDTIKQADSIVIDPHKHGLQPYGCGCVLFKDMEVGAYYKHDSPYTYFSSSELHLGEISLECSRPGASAVALWATQRMLPMTPDGEFAGSLNNCLRAARTFWLWLLSSDDFMPLMEPQIDIVIYAAKAASATASSERARSIFAAAAKDDLHLALVSVPAHIVATYWPDVVIDSESVTCLRSCLMKPEHEQWLEEIIVRLARAANVTNH